MRYERMDYFDWEEQFGPVTRVEDFDDPRLRMARPENVWTLVDAEPEPVITSGCHFVNRLEYYITQKPAPKDKFIEVF